jgi:hypothetical protein
VSRGDLGADLGIGDGNINLPIILGAVLWVAASTLAIGAARLALQCSVCGLGFYRATPSVQAL